MQLGLEPTQRADGRFSLQKLPVLEVRANNLIFCSGALDICSLNGGL